MTVPRALLADVAPRFGLVALPYPVTLAPMELSMFWSAQLDGDPTSVWFRSALDETASETFRAAAPGASRRSSRSGRTAAS
jgi:hypothetical protein